MIVKNFRVGVYCSPRSSCSHRVNLSNFPWLFSSDMKAAPNRQCNNQNEIKLWPIWTMVQAMAGSKIKPTNQRETKIRITYMVQAPLSSTHETFVFGCFAESMCGKKSSLILPFLGPLFILVTIWFHSGCCIGGWELPSFRLKTIKENLINWLCGNNWILENNILPLESFWQSFQFFCLSSQFTPADIIFTWFFSI